MSKDFATKLKTKNWGPAAPDAHKLVREHCESNGWYMNQFIEAALLAGVLTERAGALLNLPKIRLEALGSATPESAVAENGDGDTDA